MKRSQNQKTKKKNLAKGRMMPKQEGFFGSSDLEKDDNEEDVQNLKEAI